MGKNTLFVGLNVHAETIAVAVAEANGEAQSLGTIPNRPESVGKLMKKLGASKTLQVCYEAGPCGYVLYWQLVRMGIQCEVVAPTLIPVKSGDRVKTDRRDALKLARCFRNGDLTAVWVPDAAHEALRDLVRAREAAKKDQLRARHRLGKFLLRQGRRSPHKAWSARHRVWLQSMTFEQSAHQATFSDYLHEVDHAGERIVRLEHAIDEAIDKAPEALRSVIQALQALRGVAKLTAVTVATEVGRFSRFDRPRQLMGYSGAVPSEYSTGGPGKARRGPITKTGNSRLRRVLGEAAWNYYHRPALSYPLRKRQEGLSQEIKAIAWKAQHRLHDRYHRLAAKGMPQQKVVTAVSRELLGFLWAIGVQVERSIEVATASNQPKAA